MESLSRSQMEAELSATCDPNSPKFRTEDRAKQVRPARIGIRTANHASKGPRTGEATCRDEVSARGIGFQAVDNESFAGGLLQE